MRIVQIAAAVLSVGVLVGTQPAAAQSLNDVLRLTEPGLTHSARSLSMGNAYSTIGYEYTGVLFNPASVALVDSLTFTASNSFLTFLNSASYLKKQTDFNANSAKFAQFGSVIPVFLGSQRISLSLGYTQSKDFNRTLKFEGYNGTSNSVIQDLTSNDDPITSALLLSYPVYDTTTNDLLGYETLINGQLSQNGYVLDYGGLVNFSLGASLEIVGNVYLGGSLNYSSGTYLSDREFSETDSRNIYDNSFETIPGDSRTADFRQMYLHDVREAEYSGFDFRFGVLYRLWNFISAGVSFRVPTSYSIHENTTLNGFSEFGSGFKRTLPESESSVRWSVSSPIEYTLGAAVNFFIVTATAEATLVDYTQVRFTGGGDLAERSLANKQVKELFRPVLNLRGGAEFRLPFTGLSARAGFIYLPSPFVDAEHAASIDEPRQFDKKYLTLGAGINFSDRLDFDLAYALGWWEELRQNYGTGLQGVKQEVYTHNVIATVRFSL